MSGGSLADIHEARILVVDDDEMNLRLLRRILESEGYTGVSTTRDPGEVEGLVSQLDPHLVLLDLHMPKTDGFTVLTQLSARITETLLTVLVLTGDASTSAKRKALSLGARDFLAKPFDATEALLRIRNLLETKFLYQKLEYQNLRLETRVRERTADLERSQLETLERLARASEIRDDETGRHTHRVGELSGAIAEALGMDHEVVELVKWAAPLHDVGKIGIADAILLKPGQLTPEETAVMRTHTVIGARILSGGKSEMLRMAERIALSHHERWDGTGYPNRLSETAIPIEARIVAVADCVDALTHNRPYRLALPISHVLAEVRDSSGSHFDPDIVEAFLHVQRTRKIQISPPRPWPAVKLVG